MNIEALRKKYSVGKRIVCDEMNDIRAIDPGTEGTITYVDDAGQIHVLWDNHRTLALISGIDKFHLKEN